LVAIARPFLRDHAADVQLIPVAVLPGWLQTVGKIFPLSHLAIGLQRGVAISVHGTGLTGSDVGILTAWAIAGTLVAVRGFRWEPQARG
jgi:hypothetical protein